MLALNLVYIYHVDIHFDSLFPVKKNYDLRKITSHYNLISST